MESSKLDDHTTIEREPVGLVVPLEAGDLVAAARRSLTEASIATTAGERYAAAHLAALRAAAAVLAELQGQPVNPAPVVMNTCYSFVTPDEAMHVAAVYQYDATERTMKAVAGAGGVSPRASAAEADVARDWAENIWADSLALGSK